MQPAFTTLKKRADFVALNKTSNKHVAHNIIVQASVASDAPYTRVGFTATKKLGNAVIRNRCKRRMRALWRELSDRITPNRDYVLIARHSTHSIAYAQLKKDYIYCLKKLECYISKD